jgi:hypothetical protein
VEVLDAAGQMRRMWRRNIAASVMPPTDFAAEQRTSGAVQHRDSYMLLGTLMPEGDDWIYELKLDG